MRTLDVVMCFDRSFILGSGALIVSMLKHNPDTKFYFHLCVDDADVKPIADKLVKRVNALAPTGACEFSIKPFGGFAGFKKLSNALNRRRATQCARLLLGEITDYHADRVLFIDADVLCLGRVDLIFDLEFVNGEIFAATQGQDGTVNVCGTPCDGYYWAGLLIVSISKWRAAKLGDRCIDFIVQKDPKFQDQDALNALTTGKIKALPPEWQAMWRPQVGTVLLHFPGSKPWDPWAFGKVKEATNLFRQYAKLFEPDVAKWLSFRADKDALINFNVYKTRHSMKWLALKMLKQRHFKGFIYFYFKHITSKVKQKGVIGTLIMRSNTRS